MNVLGTHCYLSFLIVANRRKAAKVVEKECELEALWDSYSKELKDVSASASKNSKTKSLVPSNRPLMYVHAHPIR